MVSGSGNETPTASGHVMMCVRCGGPVDFNHAYFLYVPPKMRPLHEQICWDEVVCDDQGMPFLNQQATTGAVLTVTDERPYPIPGPHLGGAS